MKPLDVGNGLVCASTSGDGQLLSLGTVHERHGFVELNALPRFNELLRGDPVATREYRGLMLDARYAFLSVTAADGSALHEVETWMPNGVPAVVQRHAFTAQGAAPTAIRVRIRGCLDRPALAEITETDPPAPTGARTQLDTDGHDLVVRAAALPATVVVSTSTATARWLIDDDRAQLELQWPADRSTMTFELRCAFEGPESPPRSEVARWKAPAVPSPRRSTGRLIVPPHLADDLERITAGAVSYVAGCTALRETPGYRVILTDHRILPLSWTRDAYFQSLLLLACGGTEAVGMVEEHLRWLWLRCERPDATWARSHHANGKRKDGVFQVDQQLYPFIELADFWRLTGRLPQLPEGSSWGGLISETWGAVMASRDDRGLLPTAETPADDPVSHPFLLSSQVLGWYATQRLAELSEEVRLDRGKLLEAGRRLRKAVNDAFVTHADAAVWAYAIDADGRQDLYYDANDLPLGLAPVWGFCEATDPVWQATMRYAFSESNPAYLPGRYGGIGSRHTPGCWTLGDVQEWVIASLGRDAARAERVLERLALVAAPDGHLPETYDPATGQTIARHWFAWPGAVLGALWLLDRQELLDERVAVRSTSGASPD